MPMIGPASSYEARPDRPSSKDELSRHRTDATEWRCRAPSAWRDQVDRITRRCQRRSAMTMSTGIAIPMTAKMIVNASDTAICDRAGTTSGMSNDST